MEKKKIKIGKKLLIIVGIIVAIFVVRTVRNAVIISNLSKKADGYQNITNYYIKAKSSQGNIMENFYKEGRYISKLNHVSPSGIRMLTNYCDGEKINTYIETVTDEGNVKIAIPDSNGLPSVNGITNWLEVSSVKELVLISMRASVKSVELDGVQCYKINNFYGSNILHSAEGNIELHVEKETGLILRNQNGFMTDESGVKTPIITDYEYKFDVVTEEDLVEPDISEYMIQE